MKAYVINLDSRPDRLIDFQKNIFPFPVGRFVAIPTLVGDEGCAKSHLALLRTLTEYPVAIFEDDCLLIQDWEVVETAMKQLPKTWDVLWLGATLRIPLKKYSTNLFRLKKGLCLHAVIYNTQRVVDYIINNHEEPSTNKHIIDLFYSRFVQKNYNCFITYPLVATQKPGLNDISRTYVDYSKEIIEGYKTFTKVKA